MAFSGSPVVITPHPAVNLYLKADTETKLYKSMICKKGLQVSHSQPFGFVFIMQLLWSAAEPVGGYVFQIIYVRIIIAVGIANTSAGAGVV